MKKLVCIAISMVIFISFISGQNAKKLVKEGDKYLKIAESSSSYQKENAANSAYDFYIQAASTDNSITKELDFRLNTSILRGMFIDLGISFYDQKIYDKSLQNLEKALLLNEFPKNYADTTFNLGLTTYYTAYIALQGNIFDKAEKYYQVCIKNKYEESKPYYGLSELYKKTGNKSEELNILQRGFQKYPQSNDLMVGLINYYLSSGETQNALTYLNKAISSDPDNSTFYFALGTIYDNMSKDVTYSYTSEKLKENENLAVNNYQKAIKLKPDYFDAYYNMGAVYYNKAVEILKNANKLPLNEEKKYESETNKANDFLKYSLPFLEKAYTLNNSDKSTIEVLITIYGKLKMTNQKNLAQRVLDGNTSEKIIPTSLVNGQVVFKDASVDEEIARISWENPKNPTVETSHKVFNIKACLSSINTIKKIELYRNNSMIPDARGFKSVASNCQMTLNKDVTLSDGENYFKIYIEDEFGNRTESEIRTVNYNVPNATVTENIKKDIPAKKEKRLAIVIGNGNYKHGGNLGSQPINDANDLSTALKELGFDIMKVIDGTQQQIDTEIEKFGKAATGYSTILFYYAGHGVQVNGENYLIPVDANLSSEADVKYRCVPVGSILGRMFTSGSNVNIVILDACRDNPFERSWSRSSGGKGLSEIDSPVGTIISYATSPGSTASNGTGRNGLYTNALLKFIKTPELDIVDLFTKVRREVYTNSNKVQITWESNSLMGEFFLKY